VGNKKAGAERRRSCLQQQRACYFFFFAAFFAAFFFFAAIVLSMESVLNAGPIPRWIGRQQPDVRTPDWFRAPGPAAQTATARSLLLKKLVQHWC
jgi:hypothetical protein